MTLTEYLTKYEVTDQAMAELIGVSRPYVTQLRLGIREAPSLRVALKIQAKTGGKVPVETWGVAA